MVQHSKKTFRDGSYYAYAMVGKRTVKEGECAAVWDAGGRRHVIAGPRRVRLFFSHVRFLDRHIADTNQYLRVQYRDGRKEHRRGPYALFFDPCVHQSVAIDDAYQLSANEAVVVYREKGAAATVALGEAPSTPLAARTKSNGVLSPAVSVKMAAVGENGTVDRRIVSGPAIFIPDACEWVHTFSWHGSVSHGKGSKTGHLGDEKVPHALKFQKLRTQPDQMYVSVRDVRTADDASVTLHLMIFYELKHIEKMLDSTNDPIGDFYNAVAADVMTFGASQTYESLLARTAALSELGTFPISAARMGQIGFDLLKVIYRGYSTSDQLQAMHDKAIAQRTQLKLKADTQTMEQEARAREAVAKKGYVELELALKEKEASHARAQLDAAHAQKLRHKAEEEEQAADARKRANDEEVRRYGALAALGVDLTRYLCVSAAPAPDQHLRVELETPAHLKLSR